MSLLDAIDRQLLAILQSDVSLSIEELADRVGLTKTPCWRRIQKLEKSGIIRRKVALLNAEILGLPVSVFAQVKAGQQTPEWADSFAAHMAKLPEVVDCYRMAGDYDYLLRIVVRDIAAYDRFYKELIQHVGISDIVSNFALEQIKSTTELPIPPVE
ncbi:Lrp/AsnC family transcriptional regulator [Microbulbifer thermotolerans]|uniref:Transcriptional regulator n=1 Tax=Microbulbifer thermotolerans TaxID=252514 RepID=A0A143HLP0_MICTH|nr:Lrp/AsnC family transcriptional regulator [Microbulbifer thermotolerans]AMX02441.1 transcriptional regulator [Microbulbifer thermotolerans]MCX2780966.1 Lrp/AsnC family transcriptional regulator [Microbulbifer thermotolerans]MCX2784498.1 Lrp/AsnC family transcriptional regulator [Microbulbifer thermotolerans]MCX2795242.1 Lrp/AsnC family transcriptional regulator [Microbulbifer thermotolerans]MCX2802863.1 Lrp/AsnC family transcriptional regulator [Microbulbifer thermotolerans]